MSTKRIGKFTTIADGGFLLTPYLSEVTAENPATEIVATAYGQNTSSLVGRLASSVSVSGFVTTGTGMSHNAFKDISSGSDERVFTFAYGNNVVATVGDPSGSLMAERFSYQVAPDLSGAITFSANVKVSVSDDQLRYGILLANTDLTATGEQASVDNGVATTNGADVYINLTSVSSGDTIAGKIEDSANDSTWADLSPAFTLNGSVVGSEKIFISGTIRRYTRFAYTITGSSVLFHAVVNLARL